jgi:hypothetical protein
MVDSLPGPPSTESSANRLKLPPQGADPPPQGPSGPSQESSWPTQEPGRPTGGPNRPTQGPSWPTQGPSKPTHGPSITLAGNTKGSSDGELASVQDSSFEDFIFLPSLIEPVGRLTAAGSAVTEADPAALHYPRYVLCTC